MGPANCAVVDCCNSTKKLKKWRESNCEIHGVLIKDCVCVYNSPYRLFKFPSILRNGEKREKWIGQLGRENKDKTIWKPCDSDRVCIDHFVDRKPTVTHPFTELKIGCEKQIPQPRRKIFKRPVPPKKAKKHIAAETVQTSSPFRTPPRKNQEKLPEFPFEHQYCLLTNRGKSGSLVYKDILIQKYQKKLISW